MCRPNEVTVVQLELGTEQLTPRGLSSQQQEWRSDLSLNEEEQGTPRGRAEQELKLEPVQ